MNDTAKKPVLSIRLVGDGIKPEVIPVNKMNDLISAIQTLAETDMRLVNVRRSSAGYLVRSDATNDFSKLRLCGTALTQPSMALESRMIHSFDVLTTLLESLSCRLRVSMIDKSWHWTLRPKQWPAIREKFLIEDYAEVYGELKRVGGATRMKCALRVPFQKELLYCDLDNDVIARKMGQLLYQDITVRGRGLFFVRDWKLVRLKIHDFQQHTYRPFDQMYKDMREAGADGWDSIADPDAYLKELR